MNTDKIIKDTDVIILCGGLGKRLRDIVRNRPKPMLEINGRPFLDILIEYVSGFGFKRFILCAGYKGAVVEEYYKSKKWSGIELLISKEKTPLGTGGAIKNAQRLINTSIFLVMNGDSFCRIELDKFYNFHINKRPLASIALTKVTGSKDYGSIMLDDSQRIISFKEKAEADGESTINAGLYIFDKEALDLMPPNKNFSLEYDFFPDNIDKGLYGYMTKGLFIDIGTPERHKKATDVLRGL
jgi:NDP-sugar pyrophosphorylase family protein